MQAKTALRIALIAQVVVLFLGLAAHFLLQDQLPPPLAEYLAQEDRREPTVGELALLALVLPALGAHFVAIVGLYLLQPWARWVYLFVLVLFVPVGLMLGPTVEHVVQTALAELEYTLSGLVLGIAFFSDLFQGRDQHGGEIPW